VLSWLTPAFGIKNAAAKKRRRPHASSDRDKAKPGVLFHMGSSLQVGDVSIVHPGCLRTGPAAPATSGAAVTLHNAQKLCQYRSQDSTGYKFVPLTNRPRVIYTTLHDSESVAQANCPPVDRYLGTDSRGWPGPIYYSAREGSRSAPYIALRGLSLCLCQYNALLERGVAGIFVKANKVCWMHSRSHRTVEVTDWDVCSFL
jgi:hypothetical protein